MEDLQRSFNQLMNASSATLGGHNANGDASESLYEEVDVLSPVKADASSYLSGVGDLMISTGASACRSSSSFLSPRGSGSPLSSRRASSSPNSRQPKSMPHINLTAGDALDEEDDDVIEEVVDDDDIEEEVVLDQTEVEYYEDEELEIEEIELDDELYEEMVLTEKGSAAPTPSASSSTAPRPASSNTAPTMNEADTDPDDDDDDEPAEPLPSREEVAEAITYMVRQEKVVEYGLLTKKQVDEMNDLPLEEMMEIMKHFEICDNNNATIQWDLVLAMINPDYSPDAVAATNDEEDDDYEDEVGDQAQPLVGGSNSTSKGGARRRRSSGAASSTSQRSVTSNNDDDGDTVSDIHAFAHSATGHEAGDLMMMGSSYSLEVADPSETGFVSNLTAADCTADQAAGGFDSDDDADVEYQEETLQGSIVSIDPLIRASYTKSMVELQMSRPSRKDGGGGGGTSS